MAAALTIPYRFIRRGWYGMMPMLTLFELLFNYMRIDSTNEPTFNDDSQWQATMALIVSACYAVLYLTLGTDSECKKARLKVWLLIILFIALFKRDYIKCVAQILLP